VKIVGINLENSLHKLGEVNGPYGLKEKVKVIRHEAIMEDLHLIFMNI
jgi:hypothetical protein